MAGGSKKNYTVPGHGTKIKHKVVEHPETVKGANPTDKPAISPVNPKAPMQGC